MGRGAPDRIGSAAVDLSQLGRSYKTQPSEEETAGLLRSAMTAQGMVCAGCRRHIEVGFEFVAFAIVDGMMQTHRTFACARDDCGYAEVASQEAAAVRPVEWAYLKPVEVAVREPAE